MIFRLKAKAEFVNFIVSKFVYFNIIINKSYLLSQVTIKFILPKMGKITRQKSNDAEKKPKKKYISKFYDQWLKIEKFKTWLKKVPDDSGSAFCSICSYPFSIESGGIGSLESHAKGARCLIRLKDKSLSSGLGAYLNIQKSNKNRSSSASTSSAQPVLKLSLPFMLKLS